MAISMKGGTGVYIFSLTSQGFVRTETVQHPTQKAVALIEWCIEKAKAGNVVFDPYAGSGTTGVACENLNRKVRMIEINPAYCAVVLQRMIDVFPGIEIERIESNGETKRKARSGKTEARKVASDQATR